MIWRRSFRREALSNSGAIFALFFGLIAIIFLGQLLAKSSGLSTQAVLVLLTLQMFKALPQLMSFSLFAGLTICFGRMSRTSEYDAWSIAGLAVRDWYLAIARLAVPAAIVIASLSLFLVPWTIRITSSYGQAIADEVSLEATQPGSFGEIGKLGVVYHTTPGSADQTFLRDVFISREITPEQTQIIMAEKVRTDDPDNPLRSMDMEKGATYVVDLVAGKVTEFEFGQAAYQIGGETRQAIEHRLRAQPSLELLGSDDHRDQVEFFWRCTQPLAALLLALLAFAGGRVNSRSGREYKTFFTVLGFWLYMSVVGLCKELGFRSDLAPAMAALLPPALLALLLALVSRRMTRRR